MNIGAIMTGTDRTTGCKAFQCRTVCQDINIKLGFADNDIMMDSAFNIDVLLQDDRYHVRLNDLKSSSYDKNRV